MKRYFKLSTEQIEALPDEEYLHLVAQARIMNEIESDIVRDGVLRALENIRFE